MATGRGAILVVDEDVVLRQIFRIVLGSAGYDVVEAATVAAAERVLQTAEPRVDLVITGRRFKVHSGDDLLAHLRTTSPALPSICVVDGPSDALLAVPSLCKPVGRAALVAAVAQGLATRPARAEGDAPATSLECR